jgi:hypothetical protein
VTTSLLLAPACSNYHVELNPSDVGNNDRYVVQEVIKELARNRPLDVAGRRAALRVCAVTRYTGVALSCRSARVKALDVAG